ncbi:hypothetical protein EU546_01565 [Candidatus Thorarchaeota archaeon]|nr:MAG: hypothetical protein EU546_01565 [Candidatus Thorarchaeota archaeon]
MVEEIGYATKTSRFFYSEKWLLAWTIVSFVIIMACYLVRPIVDYTDDFSFLVDAVNVIGYVLIVGIPVFLPAGIVFGTSDGKEQISTLLNSGKGPLEVFLRSLVKVYALVFIFSSAISIALFFYPLLLGSSATSYLASVFVATLIVSLALASIGVIFVMITNEPLVSASMGCVLTVGLAILFGWNSRVIWWSVTRNLAILSPSNMVKIFAGLLSNYSPVTYPFDYHGLFGFTTTMDTVLLVLAVFGVVILLGFAAIIRLLKHNISVWEKEKELRRIGIWDSEKEHRRRITGIRRRYVKRSSVLVGLIIIVLTAAMVGKNSYAGMVIENTTFVFHRSSEMGERIDLGEWNIFPCEVQPPQYSLPILLHYGFIIEDYMEHDCPSELTFFSAMLNMSSSEFQSLNETERRLQGKARNRTLGNFGGRVSGIGLGMYYGPFTYVLKVIAAENETTSGFLYTRITLYQSSTLYSIPGLHW